jgi:hypothetical protein
MAKLKTVEELFKGRHFDRDVVIVCVPALVPCRIVETRAQPRTALAQPRHSPGDQRMWKIAPKPTLRMGALAPSPYATDPLKSWLERYIGDALRYLEMTMRRIRHRSPLVARARPRGDGGRR